MSQRSFTTDMANPDRTGPAGEKAEGRKVNANSATASLWGPRDQLLCSLVT